MKYHPSWNNAIFNVTSGAGFTLCYYVTLLFVVGGWGGCG